MRRRTLLAGIGALSTGCLGARSPQPSSTQSQTGASEPPTSTARPPCVSGTETPSTDSSDESATDGEYRLSGLSESTNTDGPAVTYVLEASAFYSGDAVERKAERTGEEQVVTDISAVSDDEVRDAIETAIRTGSWRSNTLPDGLAETVSRVDFFIGVSVDDTYTHIGLELYRLHPDQPPAVEFSAAIVDDTVSDESPGAIELKLTNRSSTTQTVFSGTVPPFGMVFAESGEGDDEFLLWRKYEEEGCVNFTEDSWMRCDVGKLTELQPCQSVTRRYEVLPSVTTRHPEYTVPPGPGTYRITDSLTYYEESGAPESELSFEVRFSLDAVR
ncbi:hypothetical protein [Halobaculum magnesiiphilum]|uniref:DUF8130 domain-containing protein n=1 Tax=Halobaculum magnesiiphilum TaxID=1017351 RepID=A0A8T8WCS7_9EURY|nr:hypothetical protein [Halobaculum magnesiiphilum]QZP37649.1 hypothetical protein K6T50_00250 [Halobaculum magnesiiphilum]